MNRSVAMAAGSPSGLWPLSALQGSTELYIVDNDNDVQKKSLGIYSHVCEVHVQ